MSVILISIASGCDGLRVRVYGFERCTYLTYLGDSEILTNSPWYVTKRFYFMFLFKLILVKIFLNRKCTRKVKCLGISSILQERMEIGTKFALLQIWHQKGSFQATNIIKKSSFILISHKMLTTILTPNFCIPLNNGL